MLGADAVAAVLAWSDPSQRGLPWRRTRDPWRILVSETMLQQTQAARVAPRYLAFVERFPDPRACAAAGVGQVIAEWSGLGYNRRAVSLHRAATVMVDQHGGAVPDQLEVLMALPGVGPYTARAVLAFAFECPVGVLDTNAARVLARTGGRRLQPAEAQAAADGAVPAGRAWAWNQAMLDLGATVCVARDPACPSCPIGQVGGCAWFEQGLAGPDPAVGSAGVTGRQSRFAGSDRQGRGRLVAALARRPLLPGALAAAAGWPDDPARAERAADTLVADGLALRRPDGGLTLP